MLVYQECDCEKTTKNGFHQDFFRMNFSIDESFSTVTFQIVFLDKVYTFHQWSHLDLSCQILIQFFRDSSGLILALNYHDYFCTIFFVIKPHTPVGTLFVIDEFTRPRFSTYRRKIARGFRIWPYFLKFLMQKCSKSWIYDEFSHFRVYRNIPKSRDKSPFLTTFGYKIWKNKVRFGILVQFYVDMY